MPSRIRGQARVSLQEGWSVWATVSRTLSKGLNSELTLFFLFQLHPQHMAVPRPGIKSELQLRPLPQLWQRLGIELAAPQRQAGS